MSVQQQQDDFTTAVLISFDPTVGLQLKQQAAEYCARIRTSADGWRLCLQKLHQTAAERGSDQVQFWCLQTVGEVVGHRYPSMIDEEKTVIRRSLMLYVRDIVPKVPQSHFIKTKLCTIMVQIIKHDYPQEWPTFFTSVAKRADNMPPSHQWRCVLTFACSFFPSVQ